MATVIAQTAIVHCKVELGDDGIINDFVILGIQPRNSPDQIHATVIGPQSVIRSHTVIYAGNTIGARFQSGHHAMIREFNEIGDDVSIGTQSIVEHHVRIGAGVRIHSAVFIPEYSVLERGAWVGPAVVFTNARYPLSPSAKGNLKGPHLLAGAKIGANATLLPAVTIGKNALVGAGSVVVRDVPDGAIVVGNPARIVGHVNTLQAYQATDILGAEGNGN
jgi:acetyltransferase-like isoleucine patch superfamily enzyme